MLRTIQSVFKSLKGNPLKSVLTLVTVGLGVGVLIMAMSVSTFLSEILSRELSEEGIVVTFTNAEINEDGEMERVRPPQMDANVLDVVRSDVDGVVGIAPVTGAFWNEVKVGEYTYRLRTVVASTEDYAQVMGLEAVAGTFFTAEDVEKGRRVVSDFVDELPAIQSLLQTDIVAAYEGDPAAKSTMEVVQSYPGLYAIIVHRIAHYLNGRGVPLIPRIMSESAHSLTGIDIHPGAEIGAYFFIDHGTGVVIGETCNIGEHVKLYQGVTLGALSFEKDEQGRLVKGIKRHPNVEDHVVIYAGATILGGKTTIGAHSVVGGNVWLTHSVPPHSKVYNQQPEPRIHQGKGPS